MLDSTVEIHCRISLLNATKCFRTLVPGYDLLSILSMTTFFNCNNATMDLSLKTDLLESSSWSYTSWTLRQDICDVSPMAKVGPVGLESQRRTYLARWRWEGWVLKMCWAWWCLTTPCCPGLCLRGPETDRGSPRQTGSRQSPWVSARGPARSRDSADRSGGPQSARRALCLHCWLVAEQSHWPKVKCHPGKLLVGSLSWQISCS